MEAEGYVIGLDIGGTNVRIGLVDNRYAVHNMVCVKTQTVLVDDMPVKGLAKFILSYLADYGADKRIIAVSMGLPSYIDKTRKIILGTPNIESLQNIPIVESLSEEIHLPVFIDRDVNFLMLYDVYSLRIPAVGAVAGYYFGTGLGNAVFINGQLWRGRNYSAAEMGHLPILGDETICGCGNKGCMENYASGNYLTKLAAQYFLETPINEIFLQHAETPEITRFIDYMAVAVMAEVVILDPEYIILGGGVVQMPGFPKKKLEKRILSRISKSSPVKDLRFCYSPGAQESGVVGAGMHIFKTMGESFAQPGNPAN